MSTFVMLLIAASFIYLIYFYKPHHHSEADLKKWFSSKLIEISENIENDIEKDNKGEYRHAGLQTFEKQGKITYLLVDKNYARFDISDTNDLDSTDIILTSGYKTLEDKINNLNLSMRLEENDVDGDEVETFDQMDEYIDDYPRYYTVTISGW